MNFQRPPAAAMIPLLLFGILPFIYLPITQDPEITLRYLVLSFSLTFYISIRLFRNPGAGFSLQDNPAVLAFTAYIIFSLMSLSKTLNTGDGVFELSKIIVCLILLLVMVNEWQLRPGWLQKLPVYVTISVLIFSIYGFFQFIPLLKNLFNSHSIISVSNNISSTLSNKNFFAETLLMSLPFVVYTFIWFKKSIRWLALLTAFLSFVMIIVIQSASVYFAFVICLITAFLVLLIYRKEFASTPFSFLYKMKSVLITAGILMSIFITVIVLFHNKVNYSQLSIKWKAVNDYIEEPGKIFEKNNQKNNNSVYDRLFLARNSLLMTRENPVFGNGIANWRILYSKYGLYGNNFMAAGRLRYEHPHNDYLFVLAETGIAGLCSWLAFLIFIFISAIRIIRLNSGSSQKILSFMMLLSLVAFMCTSLFGYPKERFFTMILLITLSSVIISLTSEKTSVKKISPRKYILTTLIVLLLIVFVQVNRYRSEVYLNSAFIIQKNSDFPGMQRLVEKAMSPFQVLDMTSTPLEWHLGQALYYQGKHDQAFKHYLEASLKNPYHMQVLNDLGALYEEQGDHAKALECFNRVFAMNPDFPDARMNMVALYFNTGEVDKAFNILKNHPYKYTNKWYENLKIILLSKAEKLVQSTQDTALADLLNKRIQINPNYLIGLYAESEKDSIKFEDRLKRLVR